MSDRSEIEDLLSRFMWARDDRDVDAARQCLDDPLRYAKTESAGMAAMQLGSREAFLDVLVRNDEGAFAEQHHQTNVLIEVSGNTAQAKCYLFCFWRLTQADPSDVVRVGARIQFSLRRTADGWRISGIDAQPVWTENYRANAYESQLQYVEESWSSTSKS